MKPPVQQQQSSWQKPTKPTKPAPSNHPPINKSEARLPPSKPAPMAAPRPNPRPSAAPRTTESFNEGQNSPSVNELKNKFNQQDGRKATPPIKTKPMMPPTHRPR